MLFPTIDPAVASLVSRLSAEYGLIEPEDSGIKPVRAVYDGGDSGEVKAAKLADRLTVLEPGLWLHIDHAASDDPEIRAFGHPGYENVAADRSANAYAWTSASVREVVDLRGIQLTNYRQIRTQSGALS
jgi:hypothetical protein